jgi:hypothetical protein
VGPCNGIGVRPYNSGGVVVAGCGSASSGVCTLWCATLDLCAAMLGPTGCSGGGPLHASAAGCAAVANGLSAVLVPFEVKQSTKSLYT